MRDKLKILFFCWILFVSFGMISFKSVAGAEEAASYDAHGKRDPFVPLVSYGTRQVSGLVGVEEAGDILIEGIVYDPKKGSVVIVNGAVLKEGEEMGNVKVLEIKPGGTLFLLNGTRVFKSMYQEEEQAI